MAGKTKSMSIVKQILIMHRDGMGVKSIARTLQVSKNTVKGYLQKLETAGWDIATLLSLPDPAMDAKFNGGNPAYSDFRHDYLLSQMDYFESELKRKGVTKKLLWEEYRVKQTCSYSYSQFCFHLDQQSIARKPTMVLDHAPAEKLMIDFAGKQMTYVDLNTGEEVKCQLFTAVLPHSSYVYVEAVPSQKVEDFLFAIVRCLNHLGGVPKALIPDNLKSAIIKANKYDPHINEALNDLANHYCCSIVPTRSLKPKDKAAVENGVKIAYTQVMARLRNAQFFSLEELNEAIREQTRLLNQRRMQLKEYTREEQFTSAEKPLLSPLPTAEFEIKYYKEYRVAKNNHIYLTPDKHYYSVPYTCIGQKVKVIYTRNTVRIYLKGTLVATHLRDFHKGTYSTEKTHLCSHHQAYLDRSPSYYMERAKKSGPLYDLFKAIFDQKDKHPEQLYRNCDGLLSLQKKAKDNAVFDKVCIKAIDAGAYNYTFIRTMLENKAIALEDERLPDKPLPKHENIRGKGYFQGEFPFLMALLKSLTLFINH